MLRLVVPVKQVASVDDDFEFDEGATTIEPDYLDLELNEWDNFSLEAALEIRDAAPEGEVETVVVTVGDDEADEVLVACLAKGADRAIRVWDDALTDLEPLMVASVLAAAIRAEEPDLILCGVQSSDAASSATGIALAGLLDLPHVAIVRALELDAEGGSVVAARELEGGATQRLSVPTPAVLTVQTGANDPRYATLRAIKQAAAKPLARIGLADIGLDPAAVAAARGARTARLARPSSSGAAATMLEGDAGAVADRILEIVGESVDSLKEAGS
jgi:electron transfer flavoprotein beta subunit